MYELIHHSFPHTGFCDFINIYAIKLTIASFIFYLVPPGYLPSTACLTNAIMRLTRMLYELGGQAKKGIVWQNHTKYWPDSLLDDVIILLWPIFTNILIHRIRILFDKHISQPIKNIVQKGWSGYKKKNQGKSLLNTDHPLFLMVKFSCADSYSLTILYLE